MQRSNGTGGDGDGSAPPRKANRTTTTGIATSTGGGSGGSGVSFPLSHRHGSKVFGLAMQDQRTSPTVFTWFVLLMGATLSLIGLYLSEPRLFDTPRTKVREHFHHSQMDGGAGMAWQRQKKALAEHPLSDLFVRTGGAAPPTFESVPVKSVGGAVQSPGAAADAAVAAAAPRAARHRAAVRHRQHAPSPTKPGAASSAKSKSKKKSSSSSSSLSSLALRRRERIKVAMEHAWQGYSRHAFGHDEIRPVTNQTNDSWGGWGVTMFDALDTLMLMGFDTEVAKIRQHIANVVWDKDYTASFFETTIRYLGGLLGAYELSHDALYLQKAKELGDRLIHAFSTPSGVPMSKINMHTLEIDNHQWNGRMSILSEIGSSQLEFTYLSHHTGNKTYGEIASRVYDLLERVQVKEMNQRSGLWLSYVDPKTGTFPTHINTKVSMGGLSDSAYEYLLKHYILTHGRDKRSLRMYNRVVEGMQKHLLHRVDHHHRDSTGDGDGTGEKVTTSIATGDGTRDSHSHSDSAGAGAGDGNGVDDGASTAAMRMESGNGHVARWFLGEMDPSGYETSEMEHLDCFVPGMLALGAWYSSSTSSTSVSSTIGSDTIASTTDNNGGGGGGDGSDKDVSDTTSLNTLRGHRQQHMTLAVELVNTCYQSYRTTTTGLGPEIIQYRNDNEQHDDDNDDNRRRNQKKKGETEGPYNQYFSIRSSKYILRPETLESLFVLWRTTHNVVYREWGWKIFLAIEHHCRTPSSYSGIVNVDAVVDAHHSSPNGSPINSKEKNPNWNNSMQSFYFAETLKYLYLLFSDDDLLPLDKYVFNTEAHPLGILV